MIVWMILKGYLKVFGVSWRNLEEIEEILGNFGFIFI